MLRCVFELPLPIFMYSQPEGPFQDISNVKSPLLAEQVFFFKFGAEKGKEEFIKSPCLCIFVNSYSFVNSASQSNERQYAAWQR